VGEVLCQVSFESFDTDDELALDRLTTDLGAELYEFGEVSRPSLAPMPGAKGAGELVLATLNVLTSVDPTQIEAMVRMLARFTRRNDGRRVHVRIADNELTIDRPSEQQVDALVAGFLSAVERRKR
jgi:hypothetical protein